MPGILTLGRMLVASGGDFDVDDVVSKALVFGRCKEVRFEANDDDADEPGRKVWMLCAEDALRPFA